GSLLMKLNRHAEAVACFEQALAWDPRSTEAQNDHARALEQLHAPAASESQRAAPELARSELETWRPPRDRLPATGAGQTGAHIPAPCELSNSTNEAGLKFQYFKGQSGLKYLLESTGGGVAVLDYDCDGWPDLYFPQGCRLPFRPDDATLIDRLYRNLG